MMHILRVLVYHWIYLLSVLRCTRGDAAYDLHQLTIEFYEWRMEDSPEFATYLGMYRYNDRLQSFSISQFDYRKEVSEDFLHQLDQIPQEELTKADKMNYVILRDILQSFLDGYKWRSYGAINPLNFLEGNQIDPNHQVFATPFDTRGDFENFIVRLQDTPRQLHEYQELYRTAIHYNRTLHNVSVCRVPGQIERLLVKSENSSYFVPFKNFLESLPIKLQVKKDLRERALEAAGGVIAAFGKLKSFLENEYIPKTRPHWGVGDFLNGKDYYRACLKWHLSVDLSPEEVHQKGLDEVERIVGEMKKIMQKRGFYGSVAEYFAFLRNKSELHHTSAEELLDGYRQILHERVTPRLPEIFKNLPGLSVIIEALPIDGPLGQYVGGSEDGHRPGVLQINAMRPNETAKFDMISLVLHEANPGHHLQASYAHKAKLPDFRRNMEFNRYYQVPYNFPFYTAYVEGWALYAESLGEELGLYRDDYEWMGRYGYEIFRACRLVVDTGLHYYGWKREDAIQFMLNYTSFAREEIAIEVDRYITWPGQACAYKIGELKIKELRKRAEQQLGSRFDVREFHSVVLENGAMPLRLLEETVEDWIQNYRPSSVENLCVDDAKGVSSSFAICFLMIILSGLLQFL